MRWPKKLGIKLYCFFFIWIALGGIASLLLPETEAFTYYHTMIAFHKPHAIHHTLAILDAWMTIIAIIPLCLYAFNAPRWGAWFFQPLFFTRIIADIVGRNYEWQFLKSTFHSYPAAAALSLGLMVLVLLPSYQAHFAYAFKRENAPKQ